jgi:ATP-binding cassette subfamily B protein
VFAGVLFYVSPWMALIFLILTPLLHLASRATAKRLRSTIKTFQLDFEQFNVGTHRFVQMLATTRMQACEDNQNAGYRENVARLSRSGAAMAWSGMINSQTNMLVITAIAVTLLITGGIAVARDMMTVGELGTFIFALTQVNSTTSTMIGALSTILGGDEALVRLWALRPLPREAEKRGLPPPRRPWAAIKLEEVSFGYGERRILDRLSMIIPAGETSAIVAPNGFGKTSLLELAGGLHHPAGGRILVDDQDLSRVDCTAWRRHTGFVPQHPAIFRGTIRENICFGRTGIDSAVIDRVIHMAVLDPVLSVVEGGLDAQIGDHGQLLSGGERQRVAIARALIHEPDLLILDEPTNHLDIITINMLIERLFKPRERPTILVATHDQKILAVSDQIHRLLTWDTTRAPEALA